MIGRQEEDMDNAEKRQWSEAEGWKYASKAMSWYGWGSPVGLGLFLVGLGLFLVLARRAFFGA
jgi:hypothetical protein